MIHAFPSCLRIEVWAICLLGTDRPQVRQCLIDSYSSLAGVLHHSSVLGILCCSDGRNSRGGIRREHEEQFFRLRQSGKVRYCSSRLLMASWREEADREVVEGEGDILWRTWGAQRDTNQKWPLDFSSLVEFLCLSRVLCVLVENSGV